MYNQFNGINEQVMLKDIYADRIFKDCLEADIGARKLIRRMSDDGEERHLKLRKRRRHLTLILNLLQHQIERSSKEKE